jgi:alpha-L-fucosidase
MKKRLIIIFFYLIAISGFSQKYIATEQRLKWWQDAKMGLFIHWGPVSLIGKEISWSRNGYGPSKYDSLYLRFNPKQFNAKEWVALAKASGMKYLVLTSKHHDGFCLFDTKTTSYNIMNTPFGRDVCKELAEAAHEAGMPIGWYFSVADWKDPDCRNPKTNAAFADRVEDQVREILTNYGKISLLWIDYEGSPSPIQPKRVFDLARKLQPEIIINNRLEPFNPDESHARLGQYADYTTPEGFVAGYGSVPWETCTNMGHQWAWKFNDTPRSLKESLHTLLRCVGGNGNLLFNIGPDSLGTFPINFVARAHEMGTWLAKNEKAVYGTKGGVLTPSNNYISSYKGNKMYLHLLTNVSANVNLPAIPAKIMKANFLTGKAVKYSQNNNGISLYIPMNIRDSIATIIEFTLDKSASNIRPIIPISTSKSLAYGKAATASSSLGKFLHDPTAAFDDNLETYWKPGRREDIDFSQFYGKDLNYESEKCKDLFNNKGFLEVNLGKPQRIEKIKLSERNRNSEIGKFEVQYLQNGKWIPVAKGDKMGEWTRTINPITAQKFRLEILDSKGYIGVNEFQLFSKKNNTF